MAVSGCENARPARRSRQAGAGWLAALVVLTFACSPALNWRAVSPPGADGLVASFPCRPKHDERTLRLPGLPGDSVRVHLLSCDADGATWALTYFDAGTIERQGLALAALNNALWANASASDPGASERRPLGPTQIPGMTPHPDARTWWVKGRKPDSASSTQEVQAMAWHFSKGLKVFQASVWQSGLAANDMKIEPFATGFNFAP